MRNDEKHRGLPTNTDLVQMHICREGRRNLKRIEHEKEHAHQLQKLANVRTFPRLPKTRLLPAIQDSLRIPPLGRRVNRKYGVRHPNNQLVRRRYCCSLEAKHSRSSSEYQGSCTQSFPATSSQMTALFKGLTHRSVSCHCEKNISETLTIMII